MRSDTDRPVLSLADLEAHDPEAPQGGRERRFFCPLPDPRCAGKPRDSAHRSLSLNTETGLWVCHRCGGAGRLRERWEPRRLDPRTQARRALARAFDLRASPQRPPDDPGLLAAAWAATKPLAATDGARYLLGRGIPAEIATAAEVRWSPAWFGRPAVVFPITGPQGLVAATGRYPDDRAPRFHTVGAKSEGVFRTTPDILESPVLAVTEAAIDALSLAAAGVPAIAVNGATWPTWLPARLAFRGVALAFDADEVGDRAAEQLARIVGSLGAKIERWRPMEKDWNQTLVERGPDGLRDELAAISDGV